MTDKNLFKAVIGVPVYNEEEYLNETLESLIIQDTENVKFIISDNHSTDNSWQIINDLCGHDKRFSIHKQSENKGAMYNFKYTLNKLESEYFMWVGAHDCISDGYINAMIEALDLDPTLSMAFGIPHKIIDRFDDGPLRRSIHEFPDEKLERFLYATKNIRFCTMVHSLFRKNLIKRFDIKTTFGADFVLICYLLWFGNLRYVGNHKYSARFISNRQSTEVERVTANANSYLSRHNFIQYQLDTFDSLYEGDLRMKNYLHHQIIDALQNRWGISSLLENDGQ